MNIGWMLCCFAMGAALASAGYGGSGKPEIPAPKAGAPAPEPAVTSSTTPAGIEMASIPAGEFVMGDDQGADDEKPAHRVRVDAFLIDKHEMTQKAYRALTGKSPSRFKGDTRPVEQISWYDAVKCCNLRSLREGLKPCYDEQTLKCNFEADGYRLPTEAEWEYACRAGASGKLSFGNSPQDLAKFGWSKENADRTTHPVGSKAASPWGLYDMHGNVAEWCNDFYGETAYQKADAANPQGPAIGEECVLRGGSWSKSADACRSSARASETPRFADACFGSDNYGFRCVRRPAVVPR